MTQNLIDDDENMLIVVLQQECGHKAKFIKAKSALLKEDICICLLSLIKCFSMVQRFIKTCYTLIKFINIFLSPYAHS